MLHQAYRDQRARMQAGGFSMVELLVVVAVVGMLAAVLLPSLEAARDQSRTVVCAARLQQWGQAFACYANENNGFWPHCDGLDRGPRHYRDPLISKEDLADWHGSAETVVSAMPTARSTCCRR